MRKFYLLMLALICSVAGWAEGITEGNYSFKSLRSGNYATWTGDATQMIHSGSLSLAGVWTVTSNGDGTYKLGNKATDNYYAGVSSFTAEGAKVYIKNSEYNEGYVVVSLSEDLSDKCWDASNASNKIGTWGHTSGDNQGTSWLMEAVSDDKVLEYTYNNVKEEATSAYYSLRYKGNDLNTSDCTFDNTCGDSSEGTDPTVLCDGNTSTYWHTDWHGSCSENPHWIAIEYPEALSAGLYQLTVVRRNASDDHVTEFTIYGKKDGDWKSVAVVNVPNASALATGIAQFEIKESYKSLKYAATGTTSSRTYWHAAELQLNEVINNRTLVATEAAALKTLIDATPSSYTQDAIDNLQAALDAYNAAVAKIGFYNNEVYTIYNKQNPDRILHYDGTNSYANCKADAPSTDASKWAIYTVDSKYYIYNIGAGKFLSGKSGVGSSESWPLGDAVHAVEITAATDVAGAFNLRDVTCTGGQDYLHYNGAYTYGTTNWGAGSSSANQNSMWVIACAGTLSEDKATSIENAIAEGVSKTELNEAIAKYSTYEASNAPGYSSDITALTVALAAATAARDADTYDMKQGVAAVAELESAAKSLKINMPQNNVFYRLKNKNTGKYLLNTASWTSTLNTGDGNDASSIWYIEDVDDSQYLLSYDNGKYTTNGLNIVMSDNKAAWTFQIGTVYGTITPVSSGNYSFRDYGSGNTLTWQSSTSDAASNWIFEEVTELPITMSTVGYATYSAPVDVVIPEGLTASIVSGAGVDGIVLENLEGTIPANTGVVLNGKEGDYTLAIAKSAVSGGKGLLIPTVAATAIENDGNYYFYGLSLDQNNENVGFYWMNETGAAYTSGGHKAYLKIAKSEFAGAAVKGFSLNGDIETAISNVMIENNNDTIYNLAGQRVSKATKGLYIKNGRKYLVK